MADDQKLSTALKALDEIAIICSGALSHGADGAGVIEILEAISAKARGALTEEADRLSKIEKAITEIEAWIDDDKSAPRVEEAIHQVTGMMLRLYDAVKDAVPMSSFRHCRMHIEGN